MRKYFVKYEENCIFFFISVVTLFFSYILVTVFLFNNVRIASAPSPDQPFAIDDHGSIRNVRPLAPRYNPLLILILFKL